MKKKRLMAILLAAGAAFLLAGCSQKVAKDGARESAMANEKPGAKKSSGAKEASLDEKLGGGGESQEKSGTGGQKATKVVVDHSGREVEIPAKIDRVLISSLWPLPSVYCLFEGSAEKLVGMHPASMAAAKNSILPKVAPGVLSASTDFLQGGEINVEELMNLKPDVVFYSAKNKEELEKINASGIPAVGFSTSNWDFDCIATFEGWVKLLGQVLDKEDQAQGIADYGYQVYDEVQSALGQDKDMVKPRILILNGYSNGVIKSSGKKHFGQYWINSTGGINVAEELGGTSEINMEQIYKWDPDMIYITNFTSYQPEDLYNNAIEGDDWSTVKAVREHKVYKYPLGMYRWYPPASDTPLVLKWMAQKNHPELFPHMDMEEEVRIYYKRFYHVDLTDEDIYQIFHPSREAAEGV